MADNPTNTPLPGGGHSASASPKASPSPGSGSIVVNPITPVRRVPGTPIAPVDKAPARSTTKTTTTGGSTGGTGGGGGGGIGIGGGITTWWQQLKDRLTTRPPWYHGVWPVSSLAATIRDGEFSMLSDLDKWPYNSLQFTNFDFTATLTSNNQNLTLPDGLTFFAYLEASNGTVPGSTVNQGEKISQNPLAVTCTGTYVVTNNYTLYAFLIGPNGRSVYSFPAQSLQGASMKAGMALAFQVNALIGAKVVFHVTTDGSTPAVGASVYNIGVTPMTGDAAEVPVITGPSGVTDANGNYEIDAMILLNENWTFGIAAAAAPAGSVQGSIAYMSTSAGQLNQGVELDINLAITGSVQQG